MHKRSLAPAVALVALVAAGCSNGGTNYYATASTPGVNNSSGGTGAATTGGSTGGDTGGTTTTTTTTSGTTGGLPDSGPRTPSGIQFVGTANPFLGVDYQASYSITPTNTFKFRVAAVDDAGVSGIPVTFTAGAANAQGSSLLDDTGAPVPADGGFTANSDLLGNVQGQIQAGTQAGQVTMIATVVLPNGHPASASGSSSVVGTQPSRGTSGISCTPLNLPVFSGNNPVCAVKSDFDGTITCTVTLGDRFGNAVGVSVPVHFYSEAGLWQSQTVNTPDYGTTSPTNPPGKAVNTLKSAEANLPADVDPLPGEPSYYNLCLGTVPRTYNPRDGLVTVMAAFTGEEAFVRQFGVNYWQPGDPFSDLPQPFVDNDDSSSWKAGDTCAGTSTNGSCDGPNGQWDGNANIWVENWVIYTGAPTTTIWNPSTGPTVYGLPQQGSVTWADENINLPTSQTVCNVTAPSAGEPSGFSCTYPAQFYRAGPPDALGMSVAQIEVCDAGLITVDGGQQTNTICDYQTIVTNFSQGFTSNYQLSDTTSHDGGAPYCIYSSATLFSDQPDTSSLCGTAFGP